MSKPSLGWLAVVALLLGGGTAAQAQTTTWTNTAGGFTWNTAGNWSNGIPAAAGTAEFTGTAPGNILFGGGTFNTGTLVLSNGTYSFDANGRINLTGLTHSTTGTTTLNTRLGVNGAGPLVGTLSAGTLILGNTQAGGNANQFTAANTSFTVNTGATLNAQLSGTVTVTNASAAGSSALGTATVNLAGGTLQVSGVRLNPNAGEIALGQGGLAAVFYSVTPVNLGGRDRSFDTRTRAAALQNTLSPFGPLTDPNTGTPNGNFAAVHAVTSGDSGGPPFDLAGYNVSDNFQARWIGLLRVTTAGTYTFGTRSDDGSNVYINGNQVVSNNFFQGQTTRVGTVALTAGLHLIEVNFYEGGGGAGLSLGYSGADNGNPALNTGTVDFSPVLIPLDRLTAFQARSNFGSPVNVTSSSTINADSVLEAIMGGLNISGGQTLTVSGHGMVRFPTTTLPSSGTPTYTVNTAGLGDIALGVVNNQNAGAATIVKQGGQNLILDSTTNPTVGGGLVYRIEGGRLVAVLTASANPLGANGRVAFGGAGGSVLFRTGTNVDANLPGVGLDVVAASGTVELVNSTGAARTVTLGGAVNLGGGNTLTLNPIATNMTLNLGGVVSGTGNISVQNNGTLVLSGANTYTGTTRAFGSGGVIIGANAAAFGNPAGSVVVDAGGAVGLQGNINIATPPPITISGGGGGGRPFAFGNISGTNTFGSGINLAAAATVGSQAGTLTVTGPVAAGANNLTLSGAGNLNLNGAISGTGSLTKVDAGTVTLGGANSLSGAIAVNGGVLRATTPTALGSGNITVSGSTSVLRFDAGAGNTAGGTGATVTVNNGGRIDVVSGIADLSGSAISMTATVITPGLLEGHIIGPNVWDLTTPNPGQNPTGANTPRVRMAENSSVTQNPVTGWSDNNLWIYTGQILTSASGTLSFAEQIDDNTFVNVNGTTILNNTVWNVVTAGVITGLPASTYVPIEVRMFNGGGGAGPPGNQGGSVGWTNTYGLGISDLNRAGSLNGNDYFIGGSAADPLGAARFRTITVGGATTVAGGATLRARQFTGNGSVTLSGTAGSPGQLQMVNQGAATNSALDVLALAGASAAGRVDLGTNQTLTVSRLNVAAGGTLTKVGPGVLRVTGTPDAGNTGALRVEFGTVGGTGSIPALVAAANSRVVAGNASRTGTLTVQGNTTLEHQALMEVALPANGASAPNALNLLATLGQLIGNGGTLGIYLFGNATGGYTLGTPVTFTIETHASLSGTAPTVIVDATGYTSSIPEIVGFNATGVVNSNNIQITLIPQPVPEPGAVVLIGAAGLAAVGYVRRRLVRAG